MGIDAYQEGGVIEIHGGEPLLGEIIGALAEVRDGMDVGGPLIGVGHVGIRAVAALPADCRTIALL